MAKFDPTPSQTEAVRNRGGALLVSAAAGSGKTRVLTERLMSYICDAQSPSDIDSFLVITFSRAAAAELKSRISGELAERIAADPSAKLLRRQNALLQRAQIGTIHSFCTALLRENCHLIGLVPDFAVADEDRARALKSLALEKVMDAAYEDPEPDFLLLADTVGAGRDDRRLAELVLSMHDKMQCHARPEDWAARQIAALSMLSEDAGETPWGKELLRCAIQTAEYWAGEMERLLSLMSSEEYGYIMKAYGDSIGDTACALREFSRAAQKGWDSARSQLPIPFSRLGSLRKPPDEEFAEFIKARRDSCKDEMKKLAAGFSEPSEKLMRDLERTAPAMRGLLKLVLRFDARFAAEKRRRSLVDFSDLEHFAVRLLTDENGAQTGAAREISRRFTEVMVDEYQDISEVQELIIQAVSRDGHNLFLVGDVKQSIYRFRLADPTIFIGKYLGFKDASDAAKGEPRRVLLRENFRSRHQVLDAVNAVFSNIMSTALGELDYDDKAALKPGANYTGSGAVPELLVFEPPSAEDEDRPDRTALEAAAVAGRIHELIAGGMVISDSGERQVGFGDIAVLLRSAKVVGGIYRAEFARAGIPVLSEQSGGFFDAPEITIMRSLLAVIDNPRQDVPLLAVLRSPLFGFSADELSAIRVYDKRGDFFSALCAAAETDGKSARFLKTLDSFRRFAPDTELGTLIRDIFTRLDCMAIAAAAPNGAAKRKNLMLLFELANNFENSGYKGLHRFISWLASKEERGDEPRSGSEYSGGAVRIMSIHKSKGLEFPVVFVCDTARQFNKTDSRGSVLIHPLLGPGPKLTDARRGIEYPTIAWRAVSSRILRESLSEEMRLLYVAMTRARERLFITCTLRDGERSIGETARYVQSPVPAQALAAMPCPAKWLIAAALADGEEHLRITLCSADGKGDLPEETILSKAEAAARRREIVDLSARLDWEYAHSAAISLPSKITATELKSLAEEDPESSGILPREKANFRRADFLRAGRRLSAAEKGTATHLALRYIDLRKTGSPDEITSEILRLREDAYISPAEADAVDAGAIFGLFSSDTGRRILCAESIMREFPFSLLCPARELFPGGGEEEILLQGVVDCCIEENGMLTIIDYKTDGVSAENAPGRAERYRYQLDAYSYALGRITGKPVKECILYFLGPGTAVHLIKT